MTAATTGARAMDGTIRRLFAEGSLAGMGDAELLARFADRRDEAAFEAIVRRHGPMVLATCRAVLRDDHDADDAWQSTFLTLARRAGALRADGGSLGPWLFTVAHRIAARRSPTPTAAGPASGGPPSRPPPPSSRPAGSTSCGRRSIARSPASPTGSGGRSSSATSRAGPTPRPPPRSAVARRPSAAGWPRRGACSGRGWSGPASRRPRDCWRCSGPIRPPRPGPPIGPGRSPAAHRPPPRRPAASPRGPGCSAGSRPGAGGGSPRSRRSVPSRLLRPARRPGLGGLADGDRAGTATPSRRRRVLAGRPGSRAGRRGRDGHDLRPGRAAGRLAGGRGEALCLRVPTHRPARAAPPAPEGRATADAEGRFTVEAPAPGRPTHVPGARPPTVVATLDGYGPAAAERPATDGSLTLRLAADDVPIEGRILDREGRPVAGATVQVWSLWWPHEGDLDPWLEAIERGGRGLPRLIPVSSRRLGWAGDGAGPRRRRRPGPTAGSASTGSAASGSPGSGSRGRGSRRPPPSPGPVPASRSASARSVPDRRRKNDRPRSTDRRSSTSSVRGGPSSASSATPRPGRRSPGRSSRTRYRVGNPRHHVETTTDAEGRYRLTGIPPDREFNGRTIGIASCRPRASRTSRRTRRSPGASRPTR